MAPSPLPGQEEKSVGCAAGQLENPAALQAGPTGQYMAAPCIPTKWEDMLGAAGVGTNPANAES